MTRTVLLLITFVVGTSGLCFAAPPTTTDDVVVLARQDIDLRGNIRMAAGHVVVNDPLGRVRVSRSLRAVQSGIPVPQLVADVVEIKRSPSVSGPQLVDVYANTFTDPLNSAIILGSGPTPFSVPVFGAFPSPVTVVPGTTDVFVDRRTPVTLPPGDYGKIRLGARAQIYLEGGTYNMLSFRGSLNGRIYFNGPTTVNVAERFKFGGRTIFGPVSESLLSGRCITINVASNRPAGFGRSSNVTATVSAPAAYMKLGGSGEYRGNFTATRFRIGRSAVLDSPPPLTSPCT